MEKIEYSQIPFVLKNGLTGFINRHYQQYEMYYPLSEDTKWRITGDYDKMEVLVFSLLPFVENPETLVKSLTDDKCVTGYYDIPDRHSGILYYVGGDLYDARLYPGDSPTLKVYKVNHPSPELMYHTNHFPDIIKYLLTHTTDTKDISHLLLTIYHGEKT